MEFVGRDDEFFVANEKKKIQILQAHIFFFADYRDDVEHLLQERKHAKVFSHSQLRFIPKFTFASELILHSFLFRRWSFFYFSSHLFFKRTHQQTHTFRLPSLLIVCVHNVLIFIIVREIINGVCKMFVVLWWFCLLVVRVRVLFHYSFHLHLGFICTYISYSLCILFFFLSLFLEKWISSVICMKVRERRSLNDILIARTWTTNDKYYVKWHRAKGDVDREKENKHRVDTHTHTKCKRVYRVQEGGKHLKMTLSFSLSW